MKIEIGKTYKVRNPEYCLANGFVSQDTILKKDETLTKDFIGVSGEAYYINGSVYGIYQKWESDLIEEIL